MNKLAVLAFALLMFFSTMLWYLANGSLNEYLKSQVTLQSHYYTGQQAKLFQADFSEVSGTTTFQQFTLDNINNSQQPLLLSIDKITVQLAKVPTEQLISPNIQKNTTTLVHIETLHLTGLQAWSEPENTGDLVENSKTNLERTLAQVTTKLATDYPALYPQISAKMYAKAHPELNEALALKAEPKHIEKVVEVNEAIIASKEAKQQKRLLGKAQIRVKIDSIIIDDLRLTITKSNKQNTKHYQNISLGSIGNENGLANNQVGGELLRQLLSKLIVLEQELNL